MKRGVAFACLCVVLSGMLAVSGCAPTPVSAAVQESLATSVNDFGVDLLRAAATDPRSNTIVSPVSVHAALSMTANGADGDTEREMRDVLHLGSMEVAESNAGWARLLWELDHRSSQQTLETANALWAREGVEFQQAFLDANREHFGAEVTTLDFEGGDVAGRINRWASDNTRGKITKVIEQVPPDAILYLTNAVYFKGSWDDSFEKDATHPARFAVPKVKGAMVDMMSARRDMPYFEDGAMQATRLPYKGGDSAFYVMLPREDVEVDELLEALAEGGFGNLRDELDEGEDTEVHLMLPKVDVLCRSELKEPLSALGMPAAFGPDAADFSAMRRSVDPTWIDQVSHTTKVTVDEEGTEAAAVTVVGMMEAAAVQPSGKFIICDRPYVFAIVDEPSGTMLFLGVVNDPRG